jgi:hypothetical protein
MRGGRWIGLTLFVGFFLFYLSYFGVYTNWPGLSGDWTLYLDQARNFARSGNPAATSYIFHQGQAAYSPAFYPPVHPMLLGLLFLLRLDSPAAFSLVGIVLEAAASACFVGLVVETWQLAAGEVSRRAQVLIGAAAVPFTLLLFTTELSRQIVAGYLSESSYVALILSSLMWFARYLRAPSWGKLTAAFLCAALASYVRGPGGLLIAAAGSGLVLHSFASRRELGWKGLAQTLVVPAIVWLGVTEVLTALCRQFPLRFDTPYDSDLAWSRFGGRALRDINAFMWPEMLGPFKLAAPSVRDWYEHPFFTLQAALWLVGLVVIIVEDRTRRWSVAAMWTALGAFLAMSYGVSFTTRADQGWRYLFPLLPLVMLLAVPVVALLSRARAGRPVAWLALVPLMLLPLLGVTRRTAPRAQWDRANDAPVARYLEATREFAAVIRRRFRPGCIVLTDDPRWMAWATELPTMRIFHTWQPSDYLWRVQDVCAVWDPLGHNPNIADLLALRKSEGRLLAEDAVDGYPYSLIEPRPPP